MQGSQAPKTGELGRSLPDLHCCGRSCRLRTTACKPSSNLPAAHQPPGKACLPPKCIKDMLAKRPQWSAWQPYKPTPVSYGGTQGRDGFPRSPGRAAAAAGAASAGTRRATLGDWTASGGAAALQELFIARHGHHNTSTPGNREHAHMIVLEHLITSGGLGSSRWGA